MIPYTEVSEVSTVVGADPPSARYGTQRGEPAWFITLRLIERHVLSLAAVVLIPLSWPLFWLFVTSYVIRMWGTEAVYHRYFSHRSYRASRWVQFCLAIVALQNGQRGPLWWAANHRDHHKHVDTDADPHSPAARGFAYAYSKWFLDPRNRDTNLDAIADFARFPEMRWLNRYHMVPLYAGALLLTAAAYLGIFGPSITWVGALLWGFYVPMTLALHSVSIVNSLCHMPGFPGGYRRYDTGDASVNRPLLGVLALGGAYHNNHHRHAAVARAGFAWYEFDFCYCVLRGLQGLGIISDMKSRVADDILKEGKIAAP